MSKFESKMIVIALAWGIYFLLTLTCLVALLRNPVDLNYIARTLLIIVWAIMNIGILISIGRK